jgi:hypothetical protein
MRLIVGKCSGYCVSLVYQIINYNNTLKRVKEIKNSRLS